MKTGHEKKKNKYKTTLAASVHETSEGEGRRNPEKSVVRKGRRKGGGGRKYGPEWGGGGGGRGKTTNQPPGKEGEDRWAAGREETARSVGRSATVLG